MTSSSDLRGLCVAALIAANTAAGKRVYSPRDWPTAGADYPAILVSTPDEEKDGTDGREYRNGPYFNVTVTLRVQARVSVPAGANDIGGVKALAALDVLQPQIEKALINNPTIMADGKGGLRFSGQPFVHVQNRTSAEGANHVGDLQMDIGFEFRQAHEDFYPIVGDPLTDLEISVDPTNVADPTGTYAPTFDYPVTPAPRTEGPDGRREGGIKIDPSTL